jgi:hypothetical protein
MPELNPSVQRCLTRYFTGYFASLTVHFFTICVKNQQMQQLFIQFINYVRWLTTRRLYKLFGVKGLKMDVSEAGSAFALRQKTPNFVTS